MSDLPPTLDNLEEEKFKLGSALQKGYITAGIGVGIYLLLWLSGPKVMVHWAVGLVSIVVTVVMLILLGRSERTANYGGYMSYKNAYILLLVMTTVSSVISSVFQYLIFTVIDPELSTKMAEAAMEQAVSMAESFGGEMPEEAREQIEEQVRSQTEMSFSKIGISLVSSIAVFAVINALVALGIRKNKPVF